MDRQVCPRSGIPVRLQSTQTQSYTTATMNVRVCQSEPFGAALSDELVVCSNSKPTADKELESRYH